MRGKFSFLYVDIWFDVMKCRFNVKDSSFKMLAVFLPIFVADTKISFVYNFIAPLRNLSSWLNFIQSEQIGKHLYARAQTMPNLYVAGKKLSKCV